MASEELEPFSGQALTGLCVLTVCKTGRFWFSLSFSSLAEISWHHYRPAE